MLTSGRVRIYFYNDYNEPEKRHKNAASLESWRGSGETGADEIFNGGMERCGDPEKD